MESLNKSQMYDGNGTFSEKYLKWVSNAGLKPLTNTQHKFAEFLFENEDEIKKIGDLETIFISIRKYLKNGKS